MIDSAPETRGPLTRPERLDRLRFSGKTWPVAGRFGCRLGARRDGRRTDLFHPEQRSCHATGVEFVGQAVLGPHKMALWLVWFGVNFACYGAFIWLPSLLVQQGLLLGRSSGSP